MRSTRPPAAFRETARWWNYAALPAMVALATGCASSGDTGNAPSAAPVRHPALQDFPVPSGFQLVDEHSRSRNYGAVRMVQFEYAGQTQPGAVARFYMEQMPSNGWVLKPYAFLEGEYQLRFESDMEDCSIRVRRVKSGVTTRTLINVDIGPISRAAPERTTPNRPK